VRRPRRSDPAPAPPKQAALFNVLSARWIVIEGFRIEMAAHELIGYLGDRAQHDRDAAIECDRRRSRATSSTSRLDSADPDEQLGALWRAGGR